MNRMASQALDKMETRKFKAKGGKTAAMATTAAAARESNRGTSDSLSSSSTADCAICLEKYMDGEVRSSTLPVSPAHASKNSERASLPLRPDLPVAALTCERPQMEAKTRKCVSAAPRAGSRAVESVKGIKGKTSKMESGGFIGVRNAEELDVPSRRRRRGAFSS